MVVPKPFQWPTPWLWGALLLAAAIGAEGFVDMVSSICAVIIAASVVHYFRERRRSRTPQAQPDDLTQRLGEIERRLTDTQDVMISLAEKVDQWEEERRRPRGAS
ncbi:MAG: hypothetical protein ABIL09_27935 [Gemmatimonadota bacterium]